MMAIMVLIIYVSTVAACLTGLVHASKAEFSPALFYIGVACALCGAMAALVLR